MPEIYENDWKYTRKKTVDIQIFIAIACPLFALLFLTEFNFFNPPLHRPLAILASAIMYIVIIFCLQVPISIYFLGYRRILKNSFVKKYRFDDGKLVWRGPLVNKHSIDIKDIFCILYPSEENKWNGSKLGCIYYDKHTKFLSWKSYRKIIFDTENGFKVTSKYVNKYRENSSEQPAIITDNTKESKQAVAAFRKGRIKEYKKEFWSKHSLDEF